MKPRYRLIDGKWTRLWKCPNCFQWVPTTCVKCGLTFGRRGWRQLGVYDG